MIVCFRYRSLKISLHAKEMAIGKMCVVSLRNCFFLRQQNIITEKGGAVYRNTTPDRKLRDETGNQHCDESSAVIYSPPPRLPKMEEVEF